jgi:hypothetical protein
LPPSTCGCKKFVFDALGDHVSTCTAHSGVKKAHAWAAEQLADLLRTISKVKTTQVARGRGQGCRDIELADFLADAAGPINFVSVGGVALTLCSTATSTITFLLT